PEKSEASGDDEADPAEPHRYRPVPDVNWPAHINSHQVEQRYQGEDYPDHDRKRFLVHERSSPIFYNALVATHLSRSADLSAPIGRDRVVDLIVGHRRPCTVHLFVVVANHTTLGRPTIHQIAARALAIVSFEFRVEALMPFIVAHSVVSFLRRRAYTKKHGDRAAEQRDELAAIARQILPAAAFPRFPTRKRFVDMLQRLDVALQVVRRPFSGLM